MPKACAEVQKLCLKKDYVSALTLQDTLVELTAILFCETSPSPVKYAASLMGKCLPNLRLPLVGVHSSSQKEIERILSNLGLL
jgi:4-hydroxy-tetrahydrodipicolinate synthase